MKIQFILFILLAVVGCNRIKEKSNPEKKSEYYDQCILDLAMNVPDYNLSEIFSRNKQEYESIKQNILYKGKVVRDDSLRLTFTLHSWINFGGDFAKSIISISNDTILLYAFPFNDEYSYHLRPDTIKNAKLRDVMSSKMTFGDHINFALYQVGSRVTKNDKLINRFITALNDSLLGLHEYQMNDTLKFKKEISNVFMNAKLRSKLCDSNIEKNMNHILSNCNKQNVRLFGPKDGDFGFWKFESVRQKNEFRLIATFENIDCYFILNL